MTQRNLALLIPGDLLVLAIVTMIGFASHDTLGSAGVRILATFLPLCAAWFMTAPFLGAYDLQKAARFDQLWRPFWAMVLAGPMAGILRGFWLGAAVLPLFVVIIGGFSALGLLAWRALACFTFMKPQ